MENFLENQIEETVQNVVLREDPSGEIWRTPRSACASVSERPFAKLKAWVREDHLMPRDLLPGAESVISFFLPFSREVACSNDEGVPASIQWGDADLKTSVLMEKIRFEITLLLEAGGFNCGGLPVDHDYDRDSLTSRWSHRHVAWLCGLGTFGRNNMLITESGASGRLGSMITDAPLISTPYPEGEYCLDKQVGNCGVCISRCPPSALKRSGYDKNRCLEQCLDNARDLGDDELMSVCGKCLTRLPCTFQAPVAASDREALTV